MASEFASLQLDPALLERAQVHAKHAGLTLSEWLELVIRRETVDPRSVELFVEQNTVEDLPYRYLHQAYDIGWETTVAARPLFNWHGHRSPWKHSHLKPVLYLITSFQSKINRAAVLLSMAFIEASVRDFRPVRSPRPRRRAKTWYFEVVDTCVARSLEVRSALIHKWDPTPRAERLAFDAFFILADLTPAKHELLQLCQSDRSRAFSELAIQLEAITQQVEHSARLIAEIEGVEADPQSNEDRFTAIRTMLLEKAGGGLSLTKAAELLGITRQALHKRIRARSVLGIMNGTELVLPRAQFRQIEGRYEVIPKLAEVLNLFEVAGDWSALQFLIEPDPNLGGVPIDVLTAGKWQEVVQAARAYLGDDEN